MESAEQHLPSSQQSAIIPNTSPVLLTEPPPPSSSRSSPPLQDDNDDTTVQQELLAAEPTSRSNKPSDLHARRLSFMSFMSFMSGKSTKSSKSYAEHDQDKPTSAERKSTPQGQTRRRSLASQHGSTSEAPRTPAPALPSSSARSPDAPGRASIGSEDDNVGALPAFGISERGYLASLVSLFSTGHGDHDGNSSSHSPLSSAQTALTAPSIEDGNQGAYEYDVHSPAVYAYTNANNASNDNKERRLYVGLPGTIHPPPEALLEFELETLPLLERDLQELSGHFGQRGIRITYELRMSGLTSLKGGDTVSLSPTVWILYRSYSSVGLQSCHLELQHAVSKLNYLQQRGVEIQEGGGRTELAGDRRLVDVHVHADDQIHLSGGGALSVHIEDCNENDHSVCGALCSVTIEEDDKRQTQSLCRIGGLLLVNGKYILGVSTAHAMLDSSNIFKDSFDNSAEPRSLIGKAVDRDAIVSEASRVSRWADVTRDAAVDFLGVSMNSRGEMAINRSKPENATDFALLRLRQTPGEIRNQYTPPNAEKPISITSSASASAASLDEGPVYILCGGNQVTDGQLVWGSACFVVRGRNFHLRRIQTRRPLSASAAGAWVVRGEVLYGVIIAVYEDEPFALMMTAERLFSSILGSAFSIRSVELWDGVLPEAYRLHEEERKARMKAAAAAAAAKDRVKVDVRPLSSRKGGKPGGANGSFKDTARLNTVEERVEAESEAGPSRIGTAASHKDDSIEEPIASPKSYGLPHIEASTGLGIDEGVAVASTGDSSFVTAIEETSTPKIPAMHPRTQSQASNVTMMSGAVQTPLGEEKNPLEEHNSTADIDIEDWHIKDWIPGENDDTTTDNDGGQLKTNELKVGHFDLRTGPPIRSSAASVQVAEVSSIMTAWPDGRESQDAGPSQGQQQGEASSSSEQGRGRTVTAWQLKHALDRSMGASSSSRGPSPPPKTSSVAPSLAAPVLPLPEVTSKRRFFLKRRDSLKRSSLLDETASNSSREGKKGSSFLGRFARKNAAEKSRMK